MCWIMDVNMICWGFISNVLISEIHNLWLFDVMLWDLYTFHNEAMVSRSIFSIGPNQQLIAIMKLEEHKSSDRLAGWTKRRLHRVGGSQLVEDGICRQRRSEKHSANSIMSADRSFATLIQKRVLGSVHHYKEAMFNLYVIDHVAARLCLVMTFWL